MPKKSQLEIEGKSLLVSNLEKILYPDVGFTKGDLINYYIRISPVLLPHMKQRPISLKRYPEGVNGFYFYEKQCPAHRPDWMYTTRVPSQREAGYIDYCMINDLPALVWAANLADLELHTFLHKAPAIDRPTMLAFDLDPGPPADIVACCTIALRLKKRLEDFNLQSFPKTSGSKGMQVYVPLNTKVDYEQTKSFALERAHDLEEESPDEVVSKMQKKLRPGKVFVDWSQNDPHKTTVCVYSLRAKPRPTVSTPITWDEVSSTAEKKDPETLDFESSVVLERAKEHGDLFEKVLTLKQKLIRPRQVPS